MILQLFFPYELPLVQQQHINKTLSAIWYHLYNLKNVKNTLEGVLLLVKLQAMACNFTKSNIPPWVFFTFFKLYTWYQTAQSITYTYISEKVLKKADLVSSFNQITNKLLLPSILVASVK